MFNIFFYFNFELFKKFLLISFLLLLLLFSPIYPYKSEYETLHFISTKEALQSVELVQLIDDDTGIITNLRDAVQVNVRPCNAKREKRIIIDRNSVVPRHIEVACC